MFTSTGPATYWTAIGTFVLLGMGFLAVRLPGVVREVQAESQLGDVPLRRRERLTWRWWRSSGTSPGSASACR